VKRRAFSLVVAAILAAATASHAQTTRDAPAAWGGFWLPTPAYVPMGQGFPPPPLNPAAKAQLDAARAKIRAGGVPDYCRPLKFVGYSWGNTAEVEVLVTPGRLTLIADDGLVRRIYLGAVRPPADPPPTNAGLSIGKWDGDTLVVETTALNPVAGFPFPLPGAPALGENARVVERIRLADQDTLVFEVETTAPEILAAPDAKRFVYKRQEKDIAYATPLCVDDDRSTDGKGGQRFDMTPPKDLPPPPPG
jgi:hypothetical protein